MASESLLLTTPDDHPQDNSTPIGTITCTATIPFGGAHQWLYHPSTKKFDLSRKSPRKLIIHAPSPSPHNHSGLLIDPATCVFIIIDMQNYFLHPLYRTHTAGLAAITPILASLARCRAEGIQVAWLNWGINEHDLATMAPAVQRGFSASLGWHVGLGAALPGSQGRCLFSGSWNAELYAPLRDAALPGDLFFDKTRMSGLWSPDEPLHRYLKALGKQTLLFAGVNTDQCVFGTLGDAYSAGWDCVLVGDATGTMTGRGAQELTEYQVATNMGFVTSSAALCGADVVG